MIATSPRPGGRKPRGLTLLQFLNEEYCTGRELKQSSKDQMEYAIRSLSNYLGRPVLLKELNRSLINGWIESRLTEGLSRKTVAGQRTSVLTCWREAHRLRLLKEAPLEIRKIKLLPTIPSAWTLSQFKLLLMACETLDGTFDFGTSHEPRKLVMKALFMTGFYSGLRPCDLLVLSSESLAADGRLVIIQQKTGHVYDSVLPPDAMEAVKAIHSQNRLRVFPISMRQFYHWTNECCVKASLDGSPKWLRKTGATAVEISARFGNGVPGPQNPGHLRQIKSSRPIPPSIATVLPNDEKWPTAKPLDKATWLAEGGTYATPEGGAQ